MQDPDRKALEPYERRAARELAAWKEEMLRPPSVGRAIASAVQKRVAGLIPEKAHRVITAAIRGMVQAVMAGAGFTTRARSARDDLESIETVVEERIRFYETAAAAEGALTGGAGLLAGLADFPLWLTLKMKMLFEIASFYGHDIDRPEERLFMLRVFELTFCSPERRPRLLGVIAAWASRGREPPAEPESFDWRTFQQEYRDSLDVAKLLQLVPLIGAPVGAAVNHRLTRRLGRTAMNAYRLRRGGLEGLGGTISPSPGAVSSPRQRPLPPPPGERAEGQRPAGN
jgi:uncharacterized protein (DUF697 family)